MSQEIRRHRNEEPCISNLELIFNAGDYDCKHPPFNKLAYLKSTTNKTQSQKVGRLFKIISIITFTNSFRFRYFKTEVPTKNQ